MLAVNIKLKSSRNYNCCFLVPKCPTVRRSRGYWFGFNFTTFKLAHPQLFLDIVASDAILFLIMEPSAHDLPTLATVFSRSLSASFRHKRKGGLANGFSICLNTADLLKAQD